MKLELMNKIKGYTNKQFWAWVDTWISYDDILNLVLKWNDKRCAEEFKLINKKEKE